MELLKRVQKYEGLCIKGQVDTDWNCKKKCAKIRESMH